MPIKTKRDRTRDLVEHIASGDITDDEMFACQTAFFEQGQTKLELWDITDANLKHITTNGMRQFINRAATHGEPRSGGKTAVIVRSKLQYGLGRMAEIYAEFTTLPFNFSIFQDRDKALAWLLPEQDA